MKLCSYQPDIGMQCKVVFVKAYSLACQMFLGFNGNVQYFGGFVQGFNRLRSLMVMIFISYLSPIHTNTTELLLT